MVAAQHEEVLGVLDLVGQQQHDGLQGVLPPVDVIAQEQVVGLGWEAPVLEDLDEVGELAVDVSDDFDGRLEF